LAPTGPGDHGGDKVYWRGLLRGVGGKKGRKVVVPFRQENNCGGSISLEG